MGIFSFIFPQNSRRPLSMSITAVNVQGINAVWASFRQGYFNLDN